MFLFCVRGAQGPAMFRTSEVYHSLLSGLLPVWFVVSSLYPFIVADALILVPQIYYFSVSLFSA